MKNVQSSISQSLPGILLFLLVACGGSKEPSFTIDRLKTTINQAVSNYEPTKDSIGTPYEMIKSWIPEYGVRGKYYVLKAYVGLEIIESMIGEKAFVKGPHRQKINFDSDNEFGHYNPDFLTKLNERLERILKNETFISQTQNFYNQYFKQYLRTYLLSYNIGVNNEKVISGYLKILKSTPDKDQNTFDQKNPSLYLQEEFREFAENMEHKGYNIYESFVCPGFWVRRSIDRTHEEFYTLLQTVMSAYDNDFITTQI